MAALNFKAMACWSNSIADLGFWIAEFNSDFDLILIISIRNPLTPLRHYATFEILPRVAAFITNTLEDHPAGENPNALPNLLRYIQVIILIAMKIKYFPAGNTVRVMVVCHVGVKAFGTFQ